MIGVPGTRVSDGGLMVVTSEDNQGEGESGFRRWLPGWLAAFGGLCNLYFDKHESLLA